MKKLIKSPLLFGVVYLTLIPIFALIYSLITSENFTINENITEKNFITFLYFSAVTITTLGYGDISANSSLSQILVIIETCFGITLIGLFLNSISQQQANEISKNEKIKSQLEKYNRDKEILFRNNRLIKQNIENYLLYATQITQPLSNDNVYNNDFTFNDLKNVFNQNIVLTDDHSKPIIEYFLINLKTLEDSINTLLLTTDLSNWKDLEEECITFLYNCKEYNSLDAISACYKYQLTGEDGVSIKGNHYFKKEVENYSGKLEFRSGFSLTPYLSLYYLLKNNYAFINFYNNKLRSISE